MFIEKKLNIYFFSYREKVSLQKQLQNVAIVRRGFRFEIL